MDKSEYQQLWIQIKHYLDEAKQNLRLNLNTEGLLQEYLKMNELELAFDLLWSKRYLSENFIHFRLRMLQAATLMKLENKCEFIIDEILIQ